MYDQTLRVLTQAVAQAKLGNEERLGALKRLDAEARRLEELASNADFDALMQQERDRSAELGGKREIDNQ